MADLIRVEPTVSSQTGKPDGFAWFVFDNGRQYRRRLDAEPAPRRQSAYIKRDSIAPCLGMDGKMHDSMASYRRTLRADGNPQGENYIELGTESLSPVEHKFDPKQRRDDIRAALADVKAGNIPAPAFIGD